MKKLFSLCVLLFAVHCLAQNQVNPATQVRWPAVSGTVDPASPTWPCATANYGQPYTNTTSGDAFFCGSTGWKKAGGGGTVQPTPQYRLFLQPNAGTQAVAAGATQGQNGVAPILQGNLNPDLYATGGGNNGIANAFSSADCASNCTVVVPPNSTDTEPQVMPPVGSTLLDYRGNTIYRAINSPGPLPGGGAIAMSRITCFATTSFSIMSRPQLIPTCVRLSALPQ